MFSAPEGNANALETGQVYGRHAARAVNRGLPGAEDPEGSARADVAASTRPEYGSETRAWAATSTFAEVPALSRLACDCRRPASASPRSGDAWSRRRHRESRR